MLLETGTEEMAHIELLATAVAMNLDGAPALVKESIADGDPMVQAVLGGMNPRHILSSGLSAMEVDSSGVPFNGSWIVGSGNIAADMYANVMAESTGRLLATRLWESTDDQGMKDMLSFLIARDTMHQNQWLAVLEELGGPAKNIPIPNNFPQDKEKSEFSYSFISTDITDEPTRKGRWSEGRSIDEKGEFTFTRATPHGQEPELSNPDPTEYAQNQQMKEYVQNKHPASEIPCISTINSQ